MIYVYILKSLKDEGYYVGITKSLDSRVKKHNKGQVRSTKNRRPLVVVYKEEAIAYTEAREREKEIKSYKGGVQFKALLK